MEKVRTEILLKVPHVVTIESIHGEETVCLSISFQSICMWIVDNCRMIHLCQEKICRKQDKLYSSISWYTVIFRNYIRRYPYVAQRFDLLCVYNMDPRSFVPKTGIGILLICKFNFGNQFFLPFCVTFIGSIVLILL